MFLQISIDQVNKYKQHLDVTHTLVTDTTLLLHWMTNSQLLTRGTACRVVSPHLTGCEGFGLCLGVFVRLNTNGGFKMSSVEA